MFSDPYPRPAIPTLLQLASEAQVVALTDSHGRLEEYQLIRDLVCDSASPNHFDDILIELGNSRYQDVLDAYIAGDNVPFDELAQVWRNTFGSGFSQLPDSPVYPELLETVRAVNQNAHHRKKIRVLAGDPPIEWQAIQTVDDLVGWIKQDQGRDPNAAEILNRECLSAGRRALILYGGMHIMHRQNRSTLTHILETRHSIHIPVVIAHGPHGSDLEDLDCRLENWPVPSIAMVAGTWLGQLPLHRHLTGNMRMSGERLPPDTTPWQEAFDALLYLGPGSKATFVNGDSSTLPDDYVQECARRRAIHEDLFAMARAGEWPPQA